jgi:hypothetical protein
MHDDVETRKFVCSNGTIQYRNQCLKCGVQIGKNIPHQHANPPYPAWDAELRNRFWQERWEVESSAKRSAFNAELINRRNSHRMYLQSPQWRKVREKALRRDGYRCQGCLDREATQVHHLTYERHGRELLIDLVSLCDVCHDTIHETRLEEVAS